MDGDALDFLYSSVKTGAFSGEGKQHRVLRHKYSQLHCFGDTYIVFGTVDIFVISQPKWLKFGVQAHLFKMIGHTKFQLSIFCTFKVMKLLVEVKVEQNFDKN